MSIYRHLPRTTSYLISLISEHKEKAKKLSDIWTASMQVLRDEYITEIRRNQGYSAICNGNQVLNLAESTTERLFDGRLVTSVSGLESYAACPFKFL